MFGGWVIVPPQIVSTWIFSTNYHCPIFTTWLHDVCMMYTQGKIVCWAREKCGGTDTISPFHVWWQNGVKDSFPLFTSLVTLHGIIGVTYNFPENNFLKNKFPCFLNLNSHLFFSFFFFFFFYRLSHWSPRCWILRRRSEASKEQGGCWSRFYHHTAVLYCWVFPQILQRLQRYWNQCAHHTWCNAHTGTCISI